MNVSFRKRAGRAPAPVRAATTAGALALTFASLVTVGAGAAHADVVTDESIEIDFSSPGYDPDAQYAPHGQNGWRNLSRTIIDSGMQDGALRISNAVTSGNISQIFTPALEEFAGEPSTGAGYDQFVSEFSVRSATGEFQPGLRIDVSPDNGSGARTGGTFVLHHNPASGKLDIGAIWSSIDQGGLDVADWFSGVLASVDPTVAHTVKLVHTFREGTQDVVDAYVDGRFVGSVGTYEHYHDSLDVKQTINSLLFRSSTSIPSADGKGWDVQPAVLEVAGEGFLIDDISYGVTNVDPSGTSVDIDLGGPGYLSELSGAPGGQNGWKRGFAGLDNEIVDGKLRISNATVSGIQNQLTAPQLGASAGHPEDDAEYGVFDASFRVAAVGDEFQPGLRLEVSPDDGAGSRTGGSFTLHHNPSSGTLEIGALWTELGHGTAAADDWFSEVLASVDPAVAHTVRLRHIFVDGQDVVHVWVDDTFVGTTGTYEEYHLVADSSRREINTLLFKASQSVPSGTGKGWAVQPAVPELAGKGFLVDQISYSVSEVEVPGAPTPVTAALDGTDSITATWSAPEAGSSFLTGYVVRLVAGSGAVRTVPVGPEATSRTFAHLAPDTYTVSVVATSLAGESEVASAAPVTIAALDAPAAPAAPTATAVGDDGVDVAWSAPADGGTAVTGYTVTLKSSTGSLRAASVGASTTSHTFTDLPAGSYTASVVATNAVGSSASSADSAAVTIKSAVTIHRPFFSQAKQIYGSKDRASVSAIVIGAEGSTVDFYDGSTKLGSATVEGAVATLTLARKLDVGKYKAVVATFAGDDTRRAASSAKAATFKVVKTKTVNKIRVTGKKFTKGSKPKVKIRVGRFDNGKWATGKLSIRVNGKIVRTVNVKAKHKGKITVTLPKARKTVKVKAGFKATKTVKKSWSKVTKIRVR